MSDVLSDAQMYLSEPDETVLTAALRNKDDIPILMDIVGEDDDEVPVISVSQETHLKNSLAHEEQDVALSDSAETSAAYVNRVFLAQYDTYPLSLAAGDVNANFDALQGAPAPTEVVAKKIQKLLAVGYPRQKLVFVLELMREIRCRTALQLKV